MTMSSNMNLNPVLLTVFNAHPHHMKLKQNFQFKKTDIQTDVQHNVYHYLNVYNTLKF